MPPDLADRLRTKKLHPDDFERGVRDWMETEADGKHDSR
jgi:hypothetical protein